MMYISSTNIITVCGKIEYCKGQPFGNLQHKQKRVTCIYNVHVQY